MHCFEDLGSIPIDEMQILIGIVSRALRTAALSQLKSIAVIDATYRDAPQRERAAESVINGRFRVFLYH